MLFETAENVIAESKELIRWTEFKEVILGVIQENSKTEGSKKESLFLRYREKTKTSKSHFLRPKKNNRN
jgi:hypothetical protein